ncbi:hypothetical protein C8R43DRAFT_1239019 [Mycena crocata]|nr:hypothetical protein C8R43DRAFT_1239019 [Mycena crocata]
MLVAWRVKRWVEPLLYRTVTLPSDSHRGDREDKVKGIPIHHREVITDLIQTRPPEFLGQSVRNLLMCYRRGVDNRPILSACHNIENLWIASDNLHDLLPILQGLPLTHLHCDLSKLFGSKEKIHFTHPVFSQITHLECFDDPPDLPDPERWSNIALIPNLTHLSFVNMDFLSVCHTLLQSCKSLRVVLVLPEDDSYDGVWDDNAFFEEVSKDPRFLIMECTHYAKDWQMGSHVGVDYWSRAENFIAKRRSEEVDPLQYYLEDESKLIAGIDE